MVLRKPYAFLIKHFKLIHMIMLLLMIYLVERTSRIISFFNSYVETLQLNTKIGIVKSLYNNLMTFIPFLIITMLIILIVVMFLKEKPKTYYIFNIIVYISLIIFYSSTKGIISEMEIRVVDIRTIQLSRDLLLIMLLFQFVSVVLTFVRATGFDIKKFDFVEDLQKLDISTEDNEEFELELNFGTDIKLRKLRKSIRYIKYFCVENKFLVLSVSLIIIGFISTFTYKKLGMYEKTYKENTTLEVDGVYFKIEDSYITKENYKGNTINKDYTYIILNMYSKLVYEGSNNKFSSNASLVIDNHKFYPITKYISSFYDLGINYSNQKLDTNFKNFILVYEIPNQISESKVYFKYMENSGKTVTVKLSPKEITNNLDTVENNLTEKMDFKDSTLGNVSLTLNSYELAPKYKLNYDYCINKTSCYESYEYIYPTLSGAYDKVLLKLNGKLNYDENYLLTTNLLEFIKRFGVIKYIINDKTYTNKVDIKQVKPVKSKSYDLYIEVNKDLMNADKIYFEFNIRNKKYIYNLK